MTVPKATLAKNQIASTAMSESEACHPGPAVEDTLMAGNGGSGLVAMIGVVVATAATIFALVSGRSSDPLLLTLLASFATLGIFFLFGLAAGHIRVGDRATEDDFVRAVADSLDDGVLIADRKGSVLYANRQFSRVVGAGAKSSLLTLEGAFGGTAEASEAIFRLMRAAERGEARHEQFSMKDDAGRTRFMRAAIRPFEVAGRTRELGGLVLWYLSDITNERQKQQSALELLQATLAHYDTAPVGLLATSEDGAVTHMNATFARWIGLTPRQAVDRGVTLGELLSADGAQLLAGLARQSAEDSRGIDLDLTRDDGRILPVRLFCKPTGIVEGGQGLIVVALNREEEEAVAPDDGLAEVRFARFFQSAPFGIATLGADGRIVSANAAFARMILDGKSGVSEPAVDVLVRAPEAETRAAVEAGLQQVLSGRGKVAPIDITVGQQKQYARRVYMSPLAQSRRAREVAVLYIIDSSEQKALEAKLAQSQKMEAVGKLAGGIAHDFNNVLTVIIGYSDLLLQKHRPTDGAYLEIMNIKSSANRAASLVGKLLAFSRQQTLKTEVLQLGDVLTDLAPLLKRSIGEQIELKVPTPRDLWHVKADKTQFEQVIINLVVNARDAMLDQGGGTLTMRTRNVTERESQRLGHHGMTVGEYVLIEVEDTGSGMSPEVMSKIFEPFFTTKGIGKGTGLGLATVYGIIKQTGGFIFPESTLGKGTTFRVYLPRAHVESEEEMPAPKAAKKERTGDLTGHGRVLLVEDEDMVRGFAVRALKSRGYEVLEASTGVEALQVMEENKGRVDIVVSDVVMPEMDGPTLLKELRKKNPDLKIIFVSGYPNEAFKASLDENERFAFLPKPFSLPQLAAKVKEELGR